MSVRAVAAGLTLAAALIGAGAAAEESAGGGDQATLARLEQRSKTFYDFLERGERERAAATWPDLAADLARFADGLQTRLDRMRDEIMERDGDLEELYKSQRWRDPEVMVLVATYHLAWVRYQGAQLTADKERKRALLKSAVEGFSRFLLVNEVPEIYGESLYGRGLAFLDLGDYGKAIEDLTAAAGEARVGAKARAALDEARRRAAGGKSAPAPEDPEALLGRLEQLLPKAAAGDPAVEKDATAQARGLAARGGVWPARVKSSVLRALGATDPTAVRSSYGLALLAQLAVDGGRCADVGALASASAGVTDAARTRYRPEYLFLDAGCRLNAGDARTAADGFGALLREFPDAARAREAAYYRFRALDVARAADASPTPAFEEALGFYLTRFPRADGAAEARYLRAELYRGRKDCERAARDYAEVRDGPFAARARLGALECRVAELDKTPGPRAAVLNDLRAFVRTTQARGDDRAVVARAALLAAGVAATASPPDRALVLELLDGFETRYPEVQDLHPRARDLRLTARIARGDLGAAAADLDALIADAGDAERRRTLAHLGRELATQAERAAPPVREQALALARKVYATLAAQSGDARDRLTLASLELRSGDAAAARRSYEEVLRVDATSAEAMRGAARAAAAAGDRGAALAYWRQVLETSPPGGTGWYEARLAQVTLLAEEGQAKEACEVVRLSRGRATSAGADQLEARLRAMEPQVCR